MLWGNPARTGDRLNVTQSPTVWTANSNVKSRACLRVSSIVTSPIVAQGNVIPSSSGLQIDEIRRLHQLRVVGLRTATHSRHLLALRVASLAESLLASVAILALLAALVGGGRRPLVAPHADARFHVSLVVPAQA